MTDEGAPPTPQDSVERIEQWRRYLADFRPDQKRKHDGWAAHACRLAVEAVALGTYGVGALLLDEAGEVLVSGHNQVWIGGFRSDLHAEMVVINEYEAQGWDREKARSCTLITSLEPCPMCMTRLIVAGIGTVLHVAPDSVGGMVQRREHLPPIFRQITEDHGQIWAPAECGDELRDVAFRIWAESREMLDQRFADRANPQVSG